MSEDTPPEVTLDEDTYLAWLDAGRPDFEWFLTQPPEVQSKLAELGTTHKAEEMLAQARAIHDPDAFAVAMFGTEEEREDAKARALAAEAVARVLGRDSDSPQIPDPTPRPRTMAGAIQAQQEGEQARQQERGNARRFMGRQADPFRGVET